MLFRFVGAIVGYVETFEATTFDHFLKLVRGLFTAILLSGACMDVALSAALCFYLSKQRGSALKRPVHARSYRETCCFTDIAYQDRETGGTTHIVYHT